MLLAALANPGAVQTYDSPVLIDGVPVWKEIPSTGRGALEIRDQAFGNDWPCLVDLNIGQVWQWASRLPGFDDGQPSGRAGRALSALSRLFVDRESAPVSAMWALLGLEALYGDTHGGLAHQLDKKSQCLLGERMTHKKAFSRVYNFRSRFLHGNIDFPLSYSSDQDGLEFNSEAAQAEEYATAILVATLQSLVSLNTYELNFQYALSPPLAE